MQIFRINGLTIILNGIIIGFNLKKLNVVMESKVLAGHLQRANVGGNWHYLSI